jgi:hypothetical protein
VRTPAPPARLAPLATPARPAPGQQNAAATQTTTRTTSNRTTTTTRLTVRISRHGRRYIVTGTAPSGRRLVVKLRRAGRVVATRRLTARRGRFRTTFVARRKGRYSVSVASVAGSPNLAGARGVR